MSIEAYEVGQRSDKRGVNRISDALPFGALWYAGEMQSTTQLTTQSFSVGHMMPRSAFRMKLAM